MNPIGYFLQFCIQPLFEPSSYVLKQSHCDSTSGKHRVQFMYPKSSMEGRMFNQISIVGAGRIGETFARIAKVRQIEVALSTRGTSHLLETGPIVVCTRNDDLESVLEWIPFERRRDLVFVQNGMLQTWFAGKSLESVTQALLYIAVSKIGDEPVDGLRSVVTGPESESFVWLMQELGLQCAAIPKSQFLLEMLEKLLWNCVFGLLCQVHGLSVGEVVAQHRTQVASLSLELLNVACENMRLEVPTIDGQKALVDRLCDYSKTIPDYKGAVKEWKWRNGWFWDRQQDSNSVHATLLLQAGINL